MTRQTSPKFFVPDVPTESDEPAWYSDLAYFDKESVPPVGERVYSISYTHHGEEWTSTVGETSRGVHRRTRGRGATRREVAEPLADPAKVLAIFPGNSYVIVTDNKILKKIPKSGISSNSRRMSSRCEQASYHFRSHRSPAGYVAATQRELLPRKAHRHTSFTFEENKMRNGEFNLRRWSVFHRAFVAALFIVGVGAQAFAADATVPTPAAAETAALQEVVVTGSRIPVPATISASRPTTVVTSKEIQLQGHTDITDVINALPQNIIGSNADFGNTSTPLSATGGFSTVDLRGLGPQRNLVLVNGRRLGAGDPATTNQNVAPDIDQIPAPLLERVDVVTGGASATYGSDAIAGVGASDTRVLIVGCSHPRIGVVAEAAKINPHIHFIAGGFHLVAAQDPAIEKIATTLHDTYKVDYIAPGHCTGEPSFAALQRTFGDHYLYAGLGTTLDLGANLRAASDRHATGVLDEGDLRTYRTLLAQSDDLSNGGPEIERLTQTK